MKEYSTVAEKVTVRKPLYWNLVIGRMRPGFEYDCLLFLFGIKLKALNCQYYVSGGC